MELRLSSLLTLRHLLGDTSDGYPGVRGIGPKTALKLIKEYGSVEGVIESLHPLTPAIRKKIETEMDMLLLSKKLAEIHCELKMDDTIETLQIPVYDEILRELIDREGYSMIVRQADSLFL